MKTIDEIVEMIYNNTPKSENLIELEHKAEELRKRADDLKRSSDEWKAIQTANWAGTALANVEAYVTNKKMEIKLKLTELYYAIPTIYKDSTFDNFIAQTEAQKVAVDILKDGKSAILFGSNGTGKTHLGWAFLRYQVEQGRSGRYVKAFKLFAQIKSSFNSHTTERLVDEYCNYDCLVIDELDKRYGSQTEFVNLYAIIDERTDWGRPTILIGNMKPDELEEALGPSLVSRVCGLGTPIDLSGPDWRMK